MKSSIQTTLLALLLVHFGQFAATDLLGNDRGVSIPPPSPFEDAATRLIPERDRSEAEQDRVRATALYAKGRILFNRQEFEKALRYYQRAWRYDPQSVSILKEVLKVASGVQRPDEFIRYAIIRAELDPSDPQLLRRLAGYVAQESEFERAISLLETSLEVAKNDEDDGDRLSVWFEIGRLHINNGELAKAAPYFSKLLKALDDPEAEGVTAGQRRKLLRDKARVYFLFGESFLAAGKADQALEMFERANAAKADAVNFAFRKARVRAKQDKVAEAMAELDTYLDSGSDEGGFEPYQLLEELLQKSAPDEATAIAQLKERLDAVYEKKPVPVLGYFLAEKALESDDLARAEQLYSALKKEKATLDAYEGLIEIYHQMKNESKLLAILSETVLKTGRFDNLGDSVSNVAEDAELLDKLIESARAQFAEEDAKPESGAAMAVALLCIQAERFDEADEFFELSGKQKETPASQLYLTRGLEMLMADQYDRAATALQEAIDQDIPKKDQFQYHYYLAGALEMNGHTEEALKAAKEAVSRSKKIPSIRGRIPWIYYHAKQYDEAEKSYQELVDDLDDDHSSEEVREAVRDARLMLSNVCVVTNRFPEAEEWLEQVLDEFPEDIGAMNDLGYLWADQGKHLGRALNMTRRAVAAEPDNKAYRDSLGWAYFRLGKYEEALKELETAADEEDPDGVILDHLADAQWEMGLRKEAIANWKRAIVSFEEQEDQRMLEKTRQKLEKYTAE